MTTMNPEELKALTEKAMQGQEAIKADLQAHGKKLDRLDALDLDSFKKKQDDVLNGLEAIQKNKQEIEAEAEAKARKEMHDGLEKQLSEIKNSGGELSRELTEIKGAIERLSVGGGD